MLTGKRYVLVKRAPDKATASGIQIPEAYRRAHMEWHGEVLYESRVEVTREGAHEWITLKPGAVVWFENCRAEFEHPVHEKIAIVRAEDVWGVETSNADAQPETGKVEAG